MAGDPVGTCPKHKVMPVPRETSREPVKIENIESTLNAFRSSDDLEVSGAILGIG